MNEEMKNDEMKKEEMQKTTVDAKEQVFVATPGFSGTIDSDHVEEKKDGQVWQCTGGWCGYAQR